MLGEAEPAGEGGEEGISRQGEAALLGELVEGEGGWEAAGAADLEAIVEDADGDAPGLAEVAVDQGVDHRLAYGDLGVLRAGLPWMEQIGDGAALGAHEAHRLVDEGDEAALEVGAGDDRIREARTGDVDRGEPPLRAMELRRAAKSQEGGDRR